MKRGTYVRIIPLIATPNVVPGFDDREPKPSTPYMAGHWLEGHLIEDIGLTSQIAFGCHIRNGKFVKEPWRSSPICLVVGDQIFCQRALYRILKVPPFDPQKSLEVWS